MPRKKAASEFDKILLTKEQVAEVKKRIQDAEKLLKDDRPWVRNKITDEAEIRKEIDRDKKLIENHSPKRLRGAKQNKAYKEAQVLAEKIKEAMPRVGEYYQRSPKDSDGHTKKSEFDKVVRQQMKFQTDPRIKQMIIRYKNIMRRIDPDDPTISNIEALRNR